MSEFYRRPALLEEVIGRRSAPLPGGRIEFYTHATVDQLAWATDGRHALNITRFTPTRASNCSPRPAADCFKQSATRSTANTDADAARKAMPTQRFQMAPSALPDTINPTRCPPPLRIFAAAEWVSFDLQARLVPQLRSDGL